MNREASMNRIGLTGAVMGSLVLAGCAADGPRAGGARMRLAIPSESAAPRVVVYDSLLRMLPTYRRVSALESFLVGPGHGDPPILRNPQGMALAGDELLVCDQGRAQVIALNLTSGAVRFWADADHPPANPVDVAVASNGVYVVDGKRELILSYDRSGKYAGELPSPRDRFRPACAACDGGVLYVGNVAAGTVERWSIGERRWLSPMTPPVESPPLAAPTGIAIGANGAVYVCDTLRGCVLVASPSGGAWRTIGKSGRGAGELVRPKQVAVTAGGWVAVADAGRQSVQVYDADGGHLFEICERAGTAWRGLTLPVGVIAGIPLEALASADLKDANDWFIVADAMGDPVLTAIAVIGE